MGFGHPYEVRLRCRLGATKALKPNEREPPDDGRYSNVLKHSAYEIQQNRLCGLHCYSIRRCRFALEMEKEEMTYVTMEEPLFVKEKGATSTDGM